MLEGSPRSAAEWLAALHWYTAGRGQPLQARRRIVDRLGCSKRTVARYIQIMNRMIAEPRWKGIASGRTSYQIMCTFTNDIPPNLLDGRIEPIGGLSSNQLDNLRLVLRNRRPVSADALEGISRDSNPTANPSTEAHDAVRDDQTDPSCEVSDDQPWERNDDNQ